MSCFLANSFTIFLFLRSSFTINWSNISYLQMMSFQRNLTTFLKFIKSRALTFIRSKKSSRAITKQDFSCLFYMYITLNSTLCHKYMIQIKCNDSFVLINDCRWHVSQIWTYWQISWWKLSHQYRSIIRR